MIDDLEANVDRSQTMLQRVNRRVKDLLGSASEKSKLVTIVVLMFLITMLLIAIFAL